MFFLSAAATSRDWHGIWAFKALVRLLFDYKARRPPKHVLQENNVGIILFLARLMLGLTFVASGIFKALDIPAFQNQMFNGIVAAPDAGIVGSSKILPFVTADNAMYVAFAVIALEILGGLLVIVGRPDILSRLSGLALAVFSLAAAYFYHAFWIYDMATQAQSAELQMIFFMKNVSIAGGMLLLAFRGPNDDE